MSEPTELTGAATLFRPTAPLENLRLRAELYRRLRFFFDELGFVEVSTPTLSRDVVVDRFVESIPVKIDQCWRERDALSQKRFSDPVLAKERSTTFYLQTSPEFAMKRLVAAGMQSIYQLAPAYRRGDRGELHNLEFTMLEWYRQGDDYQAGRALLCALVEQVSAQFYERTGVSRVSWSKGRVEQRSFGSVFMEYTNVNPHVCSSDDLRRYADQNGIAYPSGYANDESTTKDDWLDLIFSEAVQPHLGFESPILLYDYPASQSQLAKTGESFDPTTGERQIVSRRFELFAMGIELANGYDELLDSEALRARIEVTSAERRRDGSPELPRESRLLAAMDAGLPPCSGCALGVDRFLCVLLGARKIDEVLTFPIELA